MAGQRASSQLSQSLQKSYTQRRMRRATSLMCEWVPVSAAESYGVDSVGQLAQSGNQGLLVG